jgi:hypothetical protein
VWNMSCAATKQWPPVSLEQASNEQNVCVSTVTAVCIAGGRGNGRKRVVFRLLVALGGRIGFWCMSEKLCLPWTVLCQESGHFTACLLVLQCSAIAYSCLFCHRCLLTECSKQQLPVHHLFQYTASPKSRHRLAHT